MYIQVRHYTYLFTCIYSIHVFMQRIQCNFPCRAGGREFHTTLTRCCIARLSEKCVCGQGARGSEHNGHHSQQIRGKEVCVKNAADDELRKKGIKLMMSYRKLNTNVIVNLQGNITKDIPQIFDAVFECTLEMINKDFEDFPEHRTNFFLLLQSVTAHCFQG